MSGSTGPQTWIDGRAAGAGELAPLAFAGFAHFTAMQVRGGQVRGLDLHLARLRFASLEFFGQALPDEEVCSYLRAAIEQGPGDRSLTATMFTRRGEFTPSGDDRDPAVLVRTGPAFDGPPGPLRLAAIRFERPLAAIKHVGEAAKTYYLRQAVEAGFDDAAFIDAHGNLSEATIWNLAFWDGEAVVWPKATMLRGVTMQILRRRLADMNVPQRDEAVSSDAPRRMAGAAVMNSWTPGVAVTGIGSASLPEAETFMAILREAYEREPLRSLKAGN